MFYFLCLDFLKASGATTAKAPASKAGGIDSNNE